METIKIEILNSKVKSILIGLADLNLISIKKDTKESDFTKLLTKLRKNSEDAPTLAEITAEVESVRKERYED